MFSHAIVIMLRHSLNSKTERNKQNELNVQTNDYGALKSMNRLVRSSAYLIDKYPAKMLCPLNTYLIHLEQRTVICKTFIFLTHFLSAT